MTIDEALAALNSPNWPRERVKDLFRAGLELPDLLRDESVPPAGRIITALHALPGAKRRKAAKRIVERNMEALAAHHDEKRLAKDRALWMAAAETEAADVARELALWAGTRAGEGRQTATEKEFRAQLEDILAVVKEDIPGEPPPTSGTKTCPYCAESIQRAAKICRFCRMDLTTGLANDRPQEVHAKSGVWDGVMLGCGMFIVLPLIIILFAFFLLYLLTS